MCASLLSMMKSMVVEIPTLPSIVSVVKWSLGKPVVCGCVVKVPVLASVGEVLPWLLQVVSALLHSVRRGKRAAPVREG